MKLTYSDIVLEYNAKILVLTNLFSATLYFHLFHIFTVLFTLLHVFDSFSY